MIHIAKKSFFSAVAAGILLVPLWFFIGARSFLQPEGFFQEFFIFGIGIWFLGAAQLLFLIFLLVLLISIWSDR